MLPIAFYCRASRAGCPTMQPWWSATHTHTQSHTHAHTHADMPFHVCPVHSFQGSTHRSMRCLLLCSPLQGKQTWVPHTAALVECSTRFFQYGALPKSGSGHSRRTSSSGAGNAVEQPPAAKGKQTEAAGNKVAEIHLCII
jgi:hypothetical protein